VPEDCRSTLIFRNSLSIGNLRERKPGFTCKESISKGIDMDNVLNILKLGPPGLVFLLALMAYRLIAGAGLGGQADRHRALLIRNFMYINVVLACMTLAAPFVDWYVSHWVNIVAQREIQIDEVAANKDVAPGTAVVCNNAGYGNRYLMVKAADEENTAMVQVIAVSVMPCAVPNRITLSTDDFVKLNWGGSKGNRQVAVVVAGQGERFVLLEDRATRAGTSEPTSG
jgi:hypothetical protein